MNKLKRLKTKARIRKKIYGTANFPRLSLFKSLTSLYIQVIDDDSSSTLCSAMVKKKNIDGAKELAVAIVAKLREKNIQRVKFDRNGYIYQGVVKEVAEEIRKGEVRI